MKKISLSILLLCLFGLARSQETQEQVVRAKIDSIISLIRTEHNEGKKIDLLLAIYSISIDGYPVLMLETYQKLYSLGLEKKDIEIESSAWSLAGQGYRLAGNYIKSLESHYKGVALAEQSGNKRLLSYARNQMAHIYKDRLENEKALALYHLASINDDEKDERAHPNWWAYMNIGAVYLNMGQLDSSLFYSLKAAALLPEKTSETSYVYILSNIGSVYSRQGDLKKAGNYFAEALHTAEAYESPRFINTISIALAEHFSRIHQYDSSVYYAKKAINTVEGSLISNLALKPAKLLAEIYQHTNADSSLKYWKVYMAANDSLNSIRTNQQLMMMSFDEEQRQRNITAEKISYQNKIRTNLLLAGIAIFLLVAIILYRNNLQRKKANRKLEQTLTELKSTQTQLIQSEKMASLGELTAGIAHEIQNPLNFVNNFSEVSNELITELKEEREKAEGERDKGLEDELLNDISVNLEKITHHGKRADSIVKGMLQHSRNSSGQKELTDINALCDEYVRLSYHGLRAKDKSFNARFETDFDPSVGNLSIVPQDIGRVIMNLLTNAFYAVNEKKKEQAEGYEPTVWIKTKKEGNAVLITVADNGNGIPDAVREKIFQPFFTTKPTGEGTGLGLSLSYDIIKAHGGSIAAESSSAGTLFTIQLNL